MLARTISGGRLFVALSLIMLLSASTTVRQAPAEDGWEATINVSRIFELDGFEEMMKELVGSDVDDVHQLASDYSEVLGLNPFTDIQRIHVSGSSDFGNDDWDEFEDSIGSISIDVTQSGNLEGLLLTLEDYSSSRHDGHEIHHFSIDEFEDIYVAIVDRDNGKRIIVARSEDVMEETLDRSPSDSNRSGRRDADQLVHFSVGTSALRDFAEAELDDDVPSFAKGIVSSISRLSVEISTSGDSGEVELVVRLEMDDEDRVEQLTQLAQAGLAFGKLALADEKDDDDVAQLLELLDEISVDAEGDAIEFRLEADLIALMNSALDY